MNRSPARGLTLTRHQPGFDAAVLATSFNARDPDGTFHPWMGRAN